MLRQAGVDITGIADIQDPATIPGVVERGVVAVAERARAEGDREQQG